MISTAPFPTKSVAVGAPGQRQEFRKNLEAAGEILAHTPADSHVTIIGITDQSFAEPFMMLDARIPRDPGYFDERLAAARRALLQAWLMQTKALQPRFRDTDIFGALLLASHVFQAEPKSRRVLIIFSDMRENAGHLNLEGSNLQSAHLSRNRYGEGPGIPDLHGVEVQVLGADNAGKPMSYWTALRDFWTHYFARAGANPPDLAH